MSAETEAGLELTAAFHDEFETAGWRTAGLVTRAFDLATSVDDAVLVPALRGFIGDGAQIIAAGQARTSGLAFAYVRRLGEAELGEPVAPPVDPSNVGATWDGRRLEEGLAATIARLWRARRLGMPLPRALKVARFSAERFAFTETLDGGRQELSTAIRELDAIVGWEWISRGTCSACMALDDGSVRGAGDFIRPHPYCKCIPCPVWDQRETLRRREGRRPVKAIQRTSGRERFLQLPPEEQTRLLGEEPARWLREERIQWSDLVTEVESEEWHRMVVATSVEELRKRAGQTSPA